MDIAAFYLSILPINLQKWIYYQKSLSVAQIKTLELQFQNAVNTAFKNKKISQRQAHRLLDLWDESKWDVLENLNLY